MFRARAPGRARAQHATIAPYGPFTTAQGDAVMLAVQNEREWVALCRVLMDDPGLACDARLAARMGPVPAVGEHTDAILAGLGYSEAERDRIRKAGS